MLIGIIIAVAAVAVVAFCTFTKLGAAFATWLQNVFTWLWLTRVSVLGLVVVVFLPWSARSFARSLVIGVYDLHEWIGASMSGLLLTFAIWTVFVTAALTMGYGQRRTEVQEDRPWLFPILLRTLLFFGLALNAWTALAATDPADRSAVGWALGEGIAAGLVVVWVIEEIHERINHYEMRKYHLLWHHSNNPTTNTETQTHADAQTNADAKETNQKPEEPPKGWNFLKRIGYELNNLSLSQESMTKWRGYVATKGTRSYVLPGHGLAVLATVIWIAIYLAINFFIKPNTELTAFVYLLVLLITWVWVLAGATFFFDAHRIPVLIPLALWLFVATWFPRADHFYRIWPAEVQAAPLTPAEVLKGAKLIGRHIVLVAAAGGGIQSTAWTAKVLTELEREASAQAPAEPGRFVRSVQALSGVSGGSTGVMFFTQAYGPGGFAGPRTTEIAKPYNPKLLGEIAEAARETSLGQTTWGLAYPDLGRAFLPFSISDVFRDRAEAMENAWAYNARDAMGPLGQPLAHASLREWQADTRAGLRPAVIFNSTIVETGERLSFSTAPSRKGVEGRSEFWAPLPPNELSSRQFLYPGADIRITTAVRLSATFPFVSPNARPGVAALRNDRHLLDPATKEKSLEQITPGGNGKLHLADGGFYENSGLSDLSEWLDRGLTDLAAEPASRPTEVLVIGIEAFPETKAERENAKPLAIEEQHSAERGVFFQLFAPIKTLNNVRGSGHTAFANHGFALLQHRWLIEQTAPVRIRYVRFVLPVIDVPKKVAGKGGSFWPDWAEANPDKPPLSWHLRGPEQKAIDDAWKTLMSERQRNFGALPVEEQEAEWRSTKGHPIDKVLTFLSAPALPPGEAAGPR